MSDSHNTNNTPKTAEELVVKTVIALGAAAGAHVLGTVAHRISDMRSRKKAKDLAMEENNKDAEL